MWIHSFLLMSLPPRQICTNSTDDLYIAKDTAAAGRVLPSQCELELELVNHPSIVTEYQSQKCGQRHGETS